MARITVEGCLQKVPNRFELTLLAAKRARQLFAGARPLISNGNREVVTALREIAEGSAKSAMPGLSPGAKALVKRFSSIKT